MTPFSGFTFYFILFLSQAYQSVKALPPIIRSTNFTTTNYSKFNPNPELSPHQKMTKREEAIIRNLITHELENKTILNAVSNILSAVSYQIKNYPN